jgi:3-oxoacyl-[acyl-carrier protein] reductase
MIKAGGGAIVVVGSYAGMHGSVGQAAYAAAKAGVLGLVRSVAREWGPFNVRVNIVYPGWQRTNMTGDGEPAASVRKQHCVDRPPDLGEVARTIYHMAQSQDLSGQVWNLDSRLG